MSGVIYVWRMANTMGDLEKTNFENFISLNITKSNKIMLNTKNFFVQKLNILIINCC